MLAFGQARGFCRVSIVFLPMLFSCGTTSSRLHPFDAPAGSLRLAEAVGVVPGDQIQGQHQPLYDVLVTSGVSDAEIRAGGVGAGKAYCCWGPNERENAVFFFVPKDLTVDVGDIVELRMGRRPDNNGSGNVNVATRIRQKAGVVNGPCRWDPPREGLWNKVLYCDWMKAEGWVKQSGAVYNIWYKPVR